MSAGVDNLIEGNQKAAEQHRKAYGVAMYNQAIDDVLASIQIYNTGKEFSPLFNQLIPKIESLKKTNSKH